MKKSDRILAAGVFLSACALGFMLWAGRPRGSYVVVTVDGEEYGRYELAENQTITVNDTNRLEIADGRASMVYADCPDKLCVHMAPIGHAHELIVCMPNKIVVEAFER